MVPFSENNQWARQSFNQAMSCLQTGRQLETMGKLVAADPYYHQSLWALAACTQMLGPSVPDVVHYWMSFCQVRLGFLAHGTGNTTGGQEWLRQALGSAQSAWQRSPTNPWYQLAATQLALALGEISLARRFCQQTGCHPNLGHLNRIVEQLVRPATDSMGSDSDLIERIREWLKTGGKAIDILAALITLVGGSAPSSVPAMPGSNDMGMSWMGGLDGLSAGGFLGGM